MCLLLAACSSGPAAPEKGTPAFYWQAAKETFASGDYLKTLDHLDALNKTDNEFTARAQAWRLALTAGMTKGFIDLADNYEYGARANKANPMPFRRAVSDYRGKAAQLSLSFAEAFEKFEKTNKDPQVALAFAFPTGSAALPPLIAKVSQGIQLEPSEADGLQKRMLERSVVLMAAGAAGAPGDTAKAQEMFKSGELKVSRDAFVLSMASVLYDQSQIFVPTKLDNPDRLKYFAEHAMDAAKTVPDSKDSKEVIAKIQAALKAAAKK